MYTYIVIRLIMRETVCPVGLANRFLLIMLPTVKPPLTIPPNRGRIIGNQQQIFYNLNPPNSRHFKTTHNISATESIRYLDEVICPVFENH